MNGKRKCDRYNSVIKKNEIVLYRKMVRTGDYKPSSERQIPYVFTHAEFRSSKIIIL
jgi:hypothetical protein